MPKEYERMDPNVIAKSIRLGKKWNGGDDKTHDKEFRCQWCHMLLYLYKTSNDGQVGHYRCYTPGCLNNIDNKLQERLNANLINFKPHRYFVPFEPRRIL